MSPLQQFLYALLQWMMALSRDLEVILHSYLFFTPQFQLSTKFSQLHFQNLPDWPLFSFITAIALAYFHHFLLPYFLLSSSVYIFHIAAKVIFWKQIVYVIPLLLIFFQWLPITLRIKSKLLLMACKVSCDPPFLPFWLHLFLLTSLPVCPALWVQTLMFVGQFVVKTTALWVTISLDRAGPRTCLSAPPRNAPCLLSLPGWYHRGWS